jgi:S1-C subfamily serine protease
MEMQTGTALALALTGTFLVASVATAQDRVQIERRGVPPAGVEREMVRVESMTMSRRARLGVTVDMMARDDDKYGATINAVTPGSAAAKAGLRSGDVITAIDGKSLVANEASKNDDDQASIPGLRLVEIAAKLGIGDTITVAYRRGDEARTTKLITDVDGEDGVNIRRGGTDGSGMMRNFTFSLPQGSGARRAAMPPELADISPDMIETIDVRGEGNGASRINITMRGGVSDLELVALNPDLGKYFGTPDGVLVVNTPKEVGLGLKGGDVVFAVDGRKVTSPAQLQRILRTYEPGEALKFDVQRDRKRDAVSGKVPERKSMQLRREMPRNDEE